MLATVVHGEETAARPLLIAHGLFGSARNWGAIAKRLSDERQVIAVDMRNHGNSFWSDDHGYEDMARDLAEVIAAHGGRMHVLGHSMGGKAAMALALLFADHVDRLIVADIAPVSYDHSHADLIEAMRSVDLTSVTTRSDADRMLARSVSEPSIRAFLLQSLDVKEKRWRLNLDVLDREMGVVTAWDTLGTPFSGPTLFVAGGESHYVPRSAREAARPLFPKAKFVEIPGASHWLHTDKPREFEAAIRVYLNRDL